MPKDKEWEEWDPSVKRKLIVEIYLIDTPSRDNVITSVVCDGKKLRGEIDSIARCNGEFFQLVDGIDLVKWSE